MEGIFFLSRAGEKVEFGPALQKQIEIVWGDGGLILGNREGPKNMKKFFDGGEIENSENVGICFFTLF